MIYFTADMHLGCDKLVENSRSMYKSCEEHDELLLDALNRTVGTNDRLIIIGDFCKEKPGRYRPQIRCKNIMFVLGNHDREAKIRRVFGGNVRYQYIAKCGKERVWCSHFPMFSWDKSHYGTYHAYGHWHNNLKLECMLDAGAPGRRSMDVGVDAAMAWLGEHRPFSEAEFFEILEDQVGHETIKKEDRWTNKIRLPSAEAAYKVIMARNNQINKERQ